MKVYKVVSNENGLLTSVINHRFKRLQYAVGEITRAPEDSYGVFCFERLRDAKSFAHPLPAWLEIHVAEGIGKSNRPKEIPNAFIIEYTFDYPPKGTICFPAIKLGKLRC